MTRTPEGTFAVPFNVLSLGGCAYLPEDISQEQWEEISRYVKLLIGFRLEEEVKSRVEKLKLKKMANGLFTVRDYEPPKTVHTSDLRKLADEARKITIDIPVTTKSTS